MSEWTEETVNKRRHKRDGYRAKDARREST